MNKKLEARIARLEKRINHKMNESVEYSFYEKEAIKSCKKAFDALNDALFQVSTIEPDDNWSDVYWERVANGLERALSYFPTKDLPNKLPL